MGILSGFLAWFSSLQAKQITITELNGQLKLLEQHKTEFDFIGITSNGIDCIYFVKDGNKFQIEFEAMTESQIPFIDRLKAFASQNGYATQMKTYGNKPEYNSPDAPVLKILTNSDLEETAVIAEKIQKDVFGNNEETKYDVVP